MKWGATDHALQRVTERFGVSSAGALNWINQHMLNAEHITNAPDEQGRMRRVFIGKGVIMHVSLTDDVVYTVMKPQRREIWTESIRKAAIREIRKFNLKAMEIERELVTRRSTLEIDLINVKTTLLSIRTIPKKSAFQTRLSEISVNLADVERELNENRRSVVRMAESYSAIM
jgi:hypothetical protein